MDYLEFAIKMELDGEKYYLEQAEKNKDTNLATVFKLLAKDERKHAEIVRKYAEKSPYELTEDEALKGYKNVFEDVEDFGSEIKTDPSQIDAYRLALKKEQESIELYEKMEKEASDEEAKELFAFLVKQEKAHYKIFDEIIQHLLRAEEWVEDAEFGVRETY
jgi:rubrerythrin